MIVLFRGGHLPAHEEEHEVEDCDAFREGGDVGKACEDVGEDFGERVGEDGDGRVEEGGDGGIARAEDLGLRETLGGALAALGEEVEEEGVERAGGGRVFGEKAGDGKVGY